MTDTITAPVAEVDFGDPIVMGSVTTTGIKIIRKPVMKDMHGLSMSGELDSQQLAILLGRISDLDTPTIENMTLIDLMEVVKVIKPFLPYGEDGG